jgi:hypothetical protein
MIGWPEANAYGSQVNLNGIELEAGTTNIV